MDVYLTEEAWQHLRAEAVDHPRRRAGGLLLGHRRGGRFFVERIHPCSSGPFPGPRSYWALDNIFEGRIIGFYSSGRPRPQPSKWPPFTCNKLYLEYHPHPQKGLVLRPAVVDYSGSFYLVPATLAARPKRRR
jgi:hypothetical protein